MFTSLKEIIKKLLVFKNEQVTHTYLHFLSENDSASIMKKFFFLLKTNITCRIFPKEEERGSIVATQPIQMSYFYNAESSAKNRLNPYLLIKQLLTYDIISFDVFDTLLFRPFAKPQDLFFLLGLEFNLFNFITLRKKAETSAREQKYKNTNYKTREISLLDIYEQLEMEIGINSNLCSEIEFEAELKVCYANPYMKYIFNTLKSHGKTIIATSDMYLSRNQIERLLSCCGYIGFDEIFVSSEYKGSKRDKKLYKAVMERYGEEKSYIQIGDNEAADIQSAKNCGWNSLYYKNVNHSGNQYRPQDMSPIIRSVYSGIVNAHLHNGIQQYTINYEFGFLYGGIFILGYANFIQHYCSKNFVDKILFVSRDGYVMKQLYDKLYPNESTEYLLWSRSVNFRVAAKRSKNLILKEYVHRRLSMPEEYTLFEILTDMDVAALAEDLPSMGMKKEEVLTNKNVECFIDFIHRKWDVILSCYDGYVKATKKYLGEIVGDSKRICIVDIGWRGQTALTVKSLFEDDWEINCDVIGILAASAPTKENIAQLTNASIITYMFSPIHNVDDFNIHSEDSFFNILTELLLSAPHPSIRSISLDEQGEDYVFNFEIPEVSNYAAIQEIHQGILDFADIYIERTANYPWLQTIPGRDAYAPLKFALQHPKRIVSNFANYEFQNSVGAVVNNRNNKISDIYNVRLKGQ
ncbi:HAD-IA family hydrolase [Eubacteriales bacterium OttesenSCG-928-A19]|nr:HAD-IA family hydrolase [Eubacteriales bacterium OttesenSCG-928-A19]